MKQTPEFIVVGSGCTGAMAAQTLVEAGKEVVMLDVGFEADNLDIPAKDFLTIRKTESEQHSYFIGDKAEGVNWGKLGKGEQIAPPRHHMMRSVDELIPIQSESFSPFESLGYGGLGIGWGLGCWEWSDRELEAAGLEPKEMQTAYNLVARRIGISAAVDSAVDYTLKNLKDFQKATDTDRNHQLIYKRYLKKEQALNQKGFIMGRTPLALLTEDKDGRKKYSYKDMDFYSDAEQSAYRPWITVNQLKKAPNFSYLSNQLVTTFEQGENGVIVHSLDIKTNQTNTYRCRKLVLAPGVLGTARIVLRSFGEQSTKLPLLSNPYTYVAGLLLKNLGKEAERRKLGYAQLSLFYDEDHSNFGVSMASLYSYQSLMLFRMMRQSPFNFHDTRLFMRYLTSGLVVMGIHQPDSPSPKKFVTLTPNDTSPTGDALNISFALNEQEQARRAKVEKRYIRAMRSLGVHTIKKIDPGFGSGIHYAGVLPYDHDSKKAYTLAPNGRLNGAQNVFVADGSGFTYLPAKGLTFTLMAKAHLVAKAALKS